MTIGLACRPSVRQDRTSKNSSRVPIPPGSTTNRVGALEHLELALVHGLDDHGFGQRRMAGLALQQEAGMTPTTLPPPPGRRWPARPSGRHRRRHRPALSFSGQQDRPGCTATSREPGSVPKREPQKTQRAEGRQRARMFLHLAGIRRLSRTGTSWYHFARGRRDANSRVAPMGVHVTHGSFWLVPLGGDGDRRSAGVAWRGKMHDQADRPGWTTPRRTYARAVAGAPAPEAAIGPADPRADATSPARTGAVMAPSFDVARIGPDGRAVIAGRATPGAKIVLLDGGKEIARARPIARRMGVMAQDPPLAPGQHELRVVQHIEGRAPVTSEQVVVAVVPARAATCRDSDPPKGRDTGDDRAAGRRRDAGQPPSPAGVPKSGDLALDPGL